MGEDNKNYKIGDWVVVTKEHNWIKNGTIIQVSGKDPNMYYNNTKNGIHNWYFNDNMVRPATDSEIRAQGGTPTGSGSVKRKLSELGAREVICCSTREECEMICKLVAESGLGKRGKEHLKWPEKYYHEYPSQWCIGNLNTNEYSSYSPKSYYTGAGYTIYPASDFLPDTGVTQSEVMEENSIKWWLSRIADPVIREKALYNHIHYNQPGLVDDKPTGISTAVSWAMGWSRTPEGERYWNDIANSNPKLLDKPYQEQTSNALTNNKNQQNNGKRTEESSKYTGRSVNLQAVTTTITTGQRPRGRILSGRIQEATIRSGYLRNKVLTIK